MISITNLKKVYKLPDGTVIAALDGVSLSFEDTSFTVIRGKSGSGKSTLLNLIAGLDSITGGEIQINDVNITNYTSKQWDDIRNQEMGIIYQSYNLIEFMSVRENLRIVIDLQKTNASAENQISDMLEFVGMSGYENRRVKDLSGGQRQRIAIARALIKNPNIILADEPTGNLDEKTAEDIFKLLQKVSEKCCVLVVTHDDDLASKYAERLITLENGRIVSDKENHSTVFKYGVQLEISGNAFSEDGVNESKTFFKEKEFFDYLEDTFLSGRSGCAPLTIRTSYEPRQKKTVIGKKEKREMEKTCDTKELSSSFILQFVREGIKRRKIRLLATALVMSIACCLLFMTITFVFYNKNDVIEKCISEKHITYMQPCLDNYYTDLFNNEQGHVVFSGSVLKEKLHKLRKLGCENFNVIDDRAIFKGDDLQAKCCIIVADDFSALGFKIAGEYPKSANEIVITDYIASQLGITTDDIGCTLESGVDVKLTGIILTGYENDDILQRVSAAQMDDDSMTNLIFKYQIALVNTRYVAQAQQRSPVVYFNASNFYIYKQEKNYLGSRLLYGDVKTFEEKQVELIWGRYPKTDNEVIVSTGFAEIEGFSKSYDTIAERTYKYIDLSTAHLKGAFSDFLNIYDFMGDSIKIVGAYDSTNLENLDTDFPEVCITHNKFAEIKGQYDKNYYYDYYFVTLPDSNLSNVLQTVEAENIEYNEPTINNIYDFADFISEYQPLMIVIFIIIFILALSMMGTFISINISDSTREIGIIRSLGVTTKDTVKVYSAEALVVSTLSLIFAGVWYWIGNEKLNTWINTLLQDENGVQLVYVKPQILIATGVFMILMSILIAMIPIRKFSKKKLVTLLK